MKYNTPSWLIFIVAAIMLCPAMGHGQYMSDDELRSLGEGLEQITEGGVCAAQDARIQELLEQLDSSGERLDECLTVVEDRTIELTLCTDRLSWGNQRTEAECQLCAACCGLE